MHPSSISGINRLPDAEKRDIYKQIIPVEINERYQIDPAFFDPQGQDLIRLNCPPGSSSVDMSLFHRLNFPDPVVYGHLTDTLNGQVHILLYILNDPDSPRFDVDRLPDGTPTKFGILHRNLEAEQASLEYGLAPGQIRRGLRCLRQAITAFEKFVLNLGHDMYFVEPLYYHNAIIFERYGFAYEKGRKLMERIQSGFTPGGDLIHLLDGSTPFRRPEAAAGMRLRSWAIHDGILGEPFNDVTMYKRIGKSAGISTCGDCQW
jgi:acetoin utilization protein AcuC